MNLRTLAAVGAASILAASLTACGSSSSDSPTLTKAEWVTQANAICKDLNDRSKSLEPKSEADLAPALNKLKGIADEDVPKMAALKAPSEISSDVATLIGYYNEKIAAIESAATKAQAGDTQGSIKVITDFESSPGSKTKDLETKLGLTECSK